MAEGVNLAALAEPFPPGAIGWKPGVVSGSRCLALAYIDARDVMDRLDAVVGPAGWQDTYQIQPSGSVVCTLELSVGGEWLGKQDVGSPSEQKDEGDRLKAAFSDALKRAAVKWGVGRYLYALPAVWADYDAQKKQIAKPPDLPAWALPGGHKAAPAPQTGPPPSLAEELAKQDEYCLRKGLTAQPGDLIRAVADEVRCGGHPSGWPAELHEKARAAARAFYRQRAEAGQEVSRA